ncbi:MAG TPA: T9SS type A sorting domain-containing protein [bacterium]|nr:T9SS type A sorting domain-containing protein [bacterium]HQG44055.1 T9SS type A sorting domain-containing protein [bacterium]HQI48790.1 T9SS type A sorting domain-containing protein [bacterium]HQJ63563.1 T9SS type A sorting domain-containing protein [bacterium]
MSRWNARPIRWLLFLVFNPLVAQETIVHIHPAAAEVTVTIAPQAHVDYGFSYPLTFILNLSSPQSGLSAWYRYRQGDPWMRLPEKQSGVFFNGIAAVRFDEAAATALVSAGFSAVSDSLMLRITSATEEAVPVTCSGISPYYDNRAMAVALSADDMAGWSKDKFQRALYILRSYNLWVSCGINSVGADRATYTYIQAELDSGWVEAACHSRSHPSLPYKNYVAEVSGNREDILKNLQLPELFTSGSREYVYLWIAPNGRTDRIVDSLLTVNRFLFDRLYTSNFFGWPAWNATLQMFTNAGVARAFDPPASQLGWGIGTNDLNDLNGAFDKALVGHSVYHLMFHPNVVEWDKPYPWQHLAHISNRPDVWYAAVGHLFLYHLAQSACHIEAAVTAEAATAPAEYILSQNYPNPFNPETTISYETATAGAVTLTVYNSRGQLVARLIDGPQTAGSHRVVWHAGSHPAGIYFCQLRWEGGMATSKMVLVH